MTMQKMKSSRGLQVGVIDAPLDTSFLTVFIFHKLPRAFLLILRGSSIALRSLCLRVFAFFGLYDFLLGSVNALVMGDFLEDSLSTQILRSAMSVDTAIQHANEISCCGQNQFDVMGDEDDSTVREEGATKELLE